MSNTFESHSTIRLLNAAEVAEMLNISKRTLWRLLSSGVLPQPIRFGGNVRWPLKAVLDWLNEGCPEDFTAKIESPQSNED